MSGYCLFFVIPFVLALSPIWTVCRKKPVTNKGKISIAITLMLLCWSYYQIWSLIYGPMSKEDLGAGTVYLGGIIIFPLLPLLFTLPFAYWTSLSGKHNKPLN